jgi:hypothetical protein
LLILLPLLLFLVLLEIFPCQPSDFTGWAVFADLLCPLYLAFQALGEWSHEKHCRGTPRVVRLVLWGLVLAAFCAVFSAEPWSHHFHCPIPYPLPTASSLTRRSDTERQFKDEKRLEFASRLSERCLVEGRMRGRGFRPDLHRGGLDVFSGTAADWD